MFSQSLPRKYVNQLHVPMVGFGNYFWILSKNWSFVYLKWKILVNEFSYRKGYVESSWGKVDPEKIEKTDYAKNFIVKPVPVSNCHPLIVFLNPKSGGNQGAKLMQR